MMFSDYAPETNAHVLPVRAPLWQEPNIGLGVEAQELMDDSHSL